MMKYLIAHRSGSFQVLTPNLSWTICYRYDHDQISWHLVAVDRLYFYWATNWTVIDRFGIPLILIKWY